MGKPVLLLRLEGPLQAWGLRARWDIRDSAREPTKSGVVGLLAAALGYDRDDPRIGGELDAGLRMGVRVEREPELLDDYHTVTGFLPIAQGGYRHSGLRTAKQLAKLLAAPDVEPSTIESSRRYLCDGAFLVALATVPPAAVEVLPRCEAALRRPRWPLFLGRRACVPTRPVLEGITEGYEDVEDALRRHPWSCLGANGEPRRRPPAWVRLVLEREESGGADASAREDRRRPGTARWYGRRFVHEQRIRPPGVPGTE